MRTPNDPIRIYAEIRAEFTEGHKVVLRLMDNEDVYGTVTEAGATVVEVRTKEALLLIPYHAIKYIVKES